MKKLCLDNTSLLENRRIFSIRMTSKPVLCEPHSIVVGVRVRPFNQRELKYGSRCIIGMEGNATQIMPFENGKVLLGKPREFIFDYAFWTHSHDDSGNISIENNNQRDTEGKGNTSSVAPFSDQKYVYERLGITIVNNVFLGYNSCLFAYGQTGSGKTYSMMGTSSEPGMLPRIGQDIFNRYEKLVNELQNICTITSSFCELYNEKCRDLLGESDKNLKIRQHPQTGVFIEGIKKIDLTTNDQFVKLLETGLSHRATACTNMNNASSRSHAVVLLTISQKNENGSRTGNMYLVDLAGSERLNTSGATGASAVEGQNINLSLSTLGICLSRLAERAEGKSGIHIPYRDSSLTYLLTDSLGGNSRTSMLATISPASLNYEETLSTLRFASIAKKVKTVAFVNENPNDKLIKDLKEELLSLKSKLEALQASKKVKSGSRKSLTPITSGIVGEPPDRVVVIDGTAPPVIPVGEEHISSHTSRCVSTTRRKSESDDGGMYKDKIAELQFQIENGQESLEYILEEHETAANYLSKHGKKQPLRESKESRNSSVEYITSPISIGYDRIKRPITSNNSCSDTSLSLDSPENKTPIKVKPINIETPLEDDIVGDDASDNMERELFVDWRAPQLINLKPEEGGGLIILPIDEGVNEFEVDEEVSIFVIYDTLEMQAIIFCNTPGVAFLDGIEMDEEGSILRHNDRIVVQDKAFRFSHCARDMNDFEVKPISVEHILLLEKYERGKLREERGKNALSIGKAYFHELAALNNERSPEMTRDTNTSCTPRSTNPLLSNIADEVAMATQLIFRLEVQLAEEYPITYESKCSADKLFEVKSEDYDEAINEQRKAVDEQKKELEKLTEMMSLGDKKSIKIESEYEHLQEQINAGCLERIIEAEMNWHAKVKQLKIFRPLSHPTDRTDRVLWQRLETDPPFLSDPILKLRKNILTHISDAKENHSLWKEHFCCSSKRFLFIFPKPEIAITCVGAVYLPGATIADISNAQPSNVLSNSTVPPYIIEISPAIGRGPLDLSHSSADCSIRMGFQDKTLMQSWLDYLIVAAVPPMPLSLLKRSTKEHVAIHGTTYEIISSGSSSNDVPNRKRWKPDNFTAECEQCLKAFMVILRPRHHCRECGGLFCRKCINKKKICSNCAAVCRNTRRFGMNQIRKNNIIVRTSDVPYSFSLREDFKCSIDVIARPGEQSLIKGSEAAKKRRMQLEKYNPSYESLDGTIIFRVDHFTGRAHNIIGDEIENAERCLFNPQRLYLWLKDHTQLTLTFENAYLRERCIESLFVLMGQQMYIRGLENVLEETSVVITNELGEDAFIRATNSLITDMNIWVGVEDDRAIPFHQEYEMWVIKGYKESWSDETLKQYHLTQVCRTKINGDLYIYVIIYNDFKYKLSSYCICAVEQNDFYSVAAIGLRLLETTILFVANENNYCVSGNRNMCLNNFNQTDINEVNNSNQLFTLDRISSMNIPCVDTFLQYEHIILIGAPIDISEFYRATSTVQYRTQNIVPTKVMTVSQAGRTSAVLRVPITRHQFSSCSTHELSRLQIELISVSFNPLQQKKWQKIPTVGLPNGDILKICQLWASMGFDRVINGQVSTNPDVLRQIRAQDPTINTNTTVLFANSMPEYLSLGALFVSVPDIGTAYIPIVGCEATADGVTTTIVADVKQGGALMAVGEIKLKGTWTKLGCDNANYKHTFASLKNPSSTPNEIKQNKIV